MALEELTFTRQEDFPLVMFTPRSYSGWRFTRCTVIGNRDTYTDNYCHGVQLGTQDAGTSSDILIEDTTFTTMSYPLLQANASAAMINRVTVRDCTFSNNYADDLEFNAPNATCTDVRVEDCTFLDNQYLTAGAGFGVGLAHITRGAITGCYSSGYQNEAIHLEDYCEDILIDNNRFVDCSLTLLSIIQIISGCRGINVTNNDFDSYAHSNFPDCGRALAGGGGTTAGVRTVMPPRTD